MLLCSACVTLGLGVATSETMRTRPLSGPLDRPTLILLSVALGRFIFTTVHLIGQLCRRAETDVTAWVGFRAVYVIISVICLSVVILTGDNLVVGVIILLLELEIAVEEASRAVERTATAETQDVSTTQDRLKRALTLTGIVLALLHLLLPTTLMVIIICLLDSPFLLGPPEVGLLCFAVVYYTLTAVVLLRRQLDRNLQHRHRRLAVPQSPKVRANTTTSGVKVVVRRRPQVEAMCIDGKGRRILKRSVADLLLHAVRGRRVRSADVYNAIRIAAASTKGLARSNIRSKRRQITSLST